MSSVNSLPSPAGFDDGQISEHGASAEVEKMLRALEDLKSSYEERASELPEQHIGVYIEEIAQKLPGWSLHFDRILEIRSQIRSTMKFVLDQYQRIGRLNERDHNRRTPLHIAIMWDAVDCFELLLARGANPYNTSGAETPFQMLFGQDPWVNATAQRFNPEFMGLFCLRDLLNLWQGLLWDLGPSEHHFSFSCRTIKMTDSSIGLQSGYQDFGLGQDLIDGPWTSNRDWDDYRTWFHVSNTNIPLLYNICRTIDGIVNKRRPNAERIPVLESFCSVVRPPVVTQGNPLLTYRDSEYCSLCINGHTLGSAMVFPYLVLERMNFVLRTRAKYKSATQGTIKVPSSRYGAGHPLFLGICLDRTLDEAYFPGMDDSFFEKRNKDQVISREWRRTNKGANPDGAPLILVSQTWLWDFDSVLLSAYSIKRVSSRFPPFFIKEGRRIPRFFGQSTAPSLKLQMGIIIASQISEFGEEHDREDEGSKFKSALHMFETAVVSALSDVQQYLEARPGAYNITQQKRKEQEFIHNMSDIHSELDMITSVLEQQKKIMNKFLRETKGLQESATGDEKEGWAMVKQARASLNDYTDRVQKIHRDADRVDKTIESYLNLKRTYASIEDTRNSLMVGFAATAFAFVTVIFTPLSFMTSLFALPVDKFAQQQFKEEDSEESVFKSSYIAGYTALAGIVTWVLTIALLVGLYYYWKTSSRLEEDEDEKIPHKDDTQKITRPNDRETQDTKQNGKGSSERPKGSDSGGLRGFRIWQRKTPKQQDSSA